MHMACEICGLVAGNVIGIQSSRLLLLPHEPVIEATIKWYSGDGRDNRPA